jgi:hypothetical protein
MSDEKIYISQLEETTDVIVGVSTSLSQAMNLVNEVAVAWMVQDSAEYPPPFSGDMVDAFIKDHSGGVLVVPANKPMWWRSKDGNPEESNWVAWTRITP